MTRSQSNHRATSRRQAWQRMLGATACLVPALALLALTGCTSWSEYYHNGFKVGPNYRRPPAPVASDWIDSGDLRVRKESEDMSHWWTVFNDPILDGLIADSFRQSLTLRQAAFRVLQARAQLGFARGNLFPQTQQMTGDHTNNAISTKTANRSFVQRRFYGQYDYGFNLSWELDFWGRLRRAIEAAADNLDASVENYDFVLVTLLGDIAANYAQIRIYQAQIAYTKANVELQRSILTIVDARYKGGQVTELDVDQAQGILSQTAAEIPALEIGLRTSNNALCVLLGIAPEDLVKRIGEGRIPVAPPEVAVGVPADLIRRRPDVRMAERQAAAQAEQIGIAEAEFYPHIYLNGTLDYSAESFRNVFNQRALQATAGPSFQWNVLNYGRLLNNVRAQDALFQQLVAQYQYTVVTAAREAENGLVAFLRSQEQTQDLTEAADAAQKAVNIAFVQYKGGMIDFNRVATLEQNLVSYQNLLAQAKGAIAVGLINTYRALGGGWDYRLDPRSENAPGLNQALIAAGKAEPEVVPVPNPLKNLPQNTLPPPKEAPTDPDAPDDVTSNAKNPFLARLSRAGRNSRSATAGNWSLDTVHFPSDTGETTVVSPPRIDRFWPAPSTPSIEMPSLAPARSQPGSGSGTDSQGVVPIGWNAPPDMSSMRKGSP